MGTSENLQAWSTTAATNANADSAINWAEGQDAASVNNSSRSGMAATAKYVDDTDGALVAGGTANALTVTTNQVLSSAHLAAGLRLAIRATADNSSATVTFAPDGLTAANIKRADGSALAIGSIKNGMMLDLVYNAGSSEWRAVNIAPITNDVATQSDQETPISTTLIVTPGRQQYHPSAAKWWLSASVTAGVPALTATYNVTSITDTGVGSLTVIIANDFSSANWSPHVSVSSVPGYIANYAGPAVGSVNLFCVTNGGVLADPAAWSACGYGDQ